MPLVEVGWAILEFDGGEFALQNPNKEVPAPAGQLQEARVNALGLTLDKVEHGLDHPPRREDLPVVGDALFGFD